MYEFDMNFLFSVEVFLILFLASYDVEMLKFFFYFIEFSTQITLVESRAFSKFEAVELKNQGVLVGLVSQTQGTWT